MHPMGTRLELAMLLKHPARSDPWSRRRLLGAALGLSTGVLAGSMLRPELALAAQCLRTPAQGEGPYYPPAFGMPGADLRVAGADGTAPQGEPIVLLGRVSDAQCRPITGAVVEIWQADANGRYAHPNDSRPGQRDQLFRYWGRAVTDAQGSYRFRTIRPAPYKTGWSWRAPHVHFKVRPPGAGVLTTQMYFAGHELNEKDYLVRSVPEQQRAALIIAPQAPESAADGRAAFRFDIALA
jgi:protocatechuate 3,4-dioxygenase beta subunit